MSSYINETSPTNKNMQRRRKRERGWRHQGRALSLDMPFGSPSNPSLVFGGGPTLVFTPTRINSICFISRTFFSSTTPNPDTSHRRSPSVEENNSVEKKTFSQQTFVWFATNGNIAFVAKLLPCVCCMWLISHLKVKEQFEAERAEGKEKVGKIS